MKTCTECGETKPVEDFYKNSPMPDGLLNQCKLCVRAKRQPYRDANREKIRAYQREYAQATRGRKRAYDAAYRAANRDELLAGKRGYYLANREKHAEQSRAWKTANAARVAELDRQGHLRRTAALRDAVFGHYGEFCACCGNTEQLNIDHVNGGGAAHRKEIGTTAGVWFYRWLVANGLPDGFQTLCAPCNVSKSDGERCRLDHGEMESDAS